MLDKPRIVQTESSRTAVIHLTIARDRLGEVMGPAIGEVMSVVQAQGIGSAGPLYAHYFATDDDSFDMVVGVPIPRQDLWERYLKGPESGPDASQWVTELNRPLEDRS